MVHPGQGDGAGVRQGADQGLWHVQVPGSTSVLADHQDTTEQYLSSLLSLLLFMLTPLDIINSYSR